MTFTEAALEVLRREGKPLHFRKITEIAIQENLLDHVGKIPEEVMADQVAAHCRLPRTERRMMPVQNGTFALVEWGLDEDVQGLENLVEPPPIDELPYRGRERHPMPAREPSRGAGRGEKERRRRDEGEERKGRRFPPPAEVAYEILAGAGQPLTLAAIAAQGAERLLMPDAFVRDGAALEAALAEDNRRREAADRRPLFLVEGETVTLVAQPEPGERVPVLGAAPRAVGPAELRRTALAGLRRRLRECDPPTVEHLVGRLLERTGFREVKVAKRGREHVIFTARKRMGLADVRHCVRVVRTGADASRREVVDTRRDLGHYGAQIGVVVTPGEAAREARGEAVAAGQLPVLLLCGEALAEAFAEAGLGCVPVVIPELDEAFFLAAAELAGREEEARRARREERDRHEGEGGERRERPARREGRRGDGAPATAGGERPALVALDPAEPIIDGTPEAEPAPEEPAAGDTDAPAGAALDDDADLDGSDEGDDEEEGGPEEGAVAAAPGEGPPGEARPAGEGGRRRRRRRRRRGGRGRTERRDGTPAAAGAEGGAGPGQAGGEGGGSSAAPAAPEPRSPPAEPSGGADGA